MSKFGRVERIDFELVIEFSPERKAWVAKSEKIAVYGEGQTPDEAVRAFRENVLKPAPTVVTSAKVVTHTLPAPILQPKEDHVREWEDEELKPGLATRIDYSEVEVDLKNPPKRRRGRPKKVKEQHDNGNKADIEEPNE